MQNYGHYFEKMVPKLPRRTMGMQKLLMISLRFEEISLHCRNMAIIHQFCGIMGSNFSDIGGIMGHKFEPKWSVPM